MKISSFPRYIVLPDDGNTLKISRETKPAAYERLVRFKGGIGRYFSNESSYCFPEYIKEQLKGHSDWVAFIQCADGVAGFYCLDGAIQQVETGSFDDVLGALAATCEVTQLIVVPDDSWEGSFPGRQCVCQEFDLTNLPAELKLKPQRHVPKIAFLLGGVCLLIFLVVGLWPDKKELAPEVDPVAVWRGEFMSSVAASHAFNAAASAISYGFLLPRDWKVGGVVLSGNRIEAALTPVSDGRGSLRNLEAYRDWYRADVNMNSQTLSVPIPERGTWGEIDVDDYSIHLHDTLVNLGAQSVSVEPGVSIGPIKKILVNVTFPNVQFSILHDLANSVYNAPVNVSSLTITPANQHKINIDATLSIEGVRMI